MHTTVVTSHQGAGSNVKGICIQSPIAIIERTQAIIHGVLTRLPQAAPRGYADRNAIPRAGSQSENRIFFLSSVNRDRTMCGKHGNEQARRNITGPAKNIQSGAIQRERRKMKPTIVIKMSIGMTNTARKKASPNRFPA